MRNLSLKSFSNKLNAVLYLILKRVYYFVLRRIHKYLQIPPFLTSPPSAMSLLMDNIWVYIAREGIPGDYLEFGCYRGGSFISAYQSAQKVKRWEWQESWPDIRFFAFDSFAGLPPHENEGRFQAGTYSCSQQEFLENLEQAQVDLARVRIIEGWYSETLTDTTKQKTGLSAASVIMIDCDIYESTKQVLNFVTSLLQNGTIIIFNDWWCYRARPDQGEQKACNEWLKENPTITLYEFWKQGYANIAFVVRVD